MRLTPIPSQVIRAASLLRGSHETRLIPRWALDPAGTMRCNPDYRPSSPDRSWDRRERSGPQENTMQFRGRDRRDVKRKVLTYWAAHSRSLGLSLQEFLAHCRMGPNEQTIVFIQPQS